MILGWIAVVFTALYMGGGIYTDGVLEMDGAILVVSALDGPMP